MIELTQPEANASNSQVAVHLPVKTLSSLKKEFNISDSEIDSFVTSIINKAIEEHIGEANSKIFSESETKEMEDDLKGLGYI